MRILLLTHEFLPFSGGVGRYCHDLAAAAAKRGHDVTVLAPSYGGPVCEEEITTGLTVQRFTGGKFRAYNTFSAITALIRALRKNDWDIVHAADWPFVLLCCLLRKFVRLSYCATIHGTDIPIIKSGRLARTLRSTEGYCKAESVSANSAFTLQRLRTFYPDQAWSNAHVTYLGVSPFWATPVVEAEIKEVKGKYEIDPSLRCVISVGRLDERKGQHLVLAALAEAPKELTRNLAYLIVGKPDDQEYLRRLKALAADSPAKIYFLQGLNDHEVRALLAGSEVFCVPGAKVSDGRVEGFGLAYLEAAAQGLPSIGPRMWAVPEVIRDGETGLLVDPTDVESITSALTRLLSDNSLRTEMGERARSWSQSFTWDRCAAQTYEATT